MVFGQKGHCVSDIFNEPFDVVLGEKFIRIQSAIKKIPESDLNIFQEAGPGISLDLNAVLEGHWAQSEKSLMFDFFLVYRLMPDRMIGTMALAVCS
jgi:hypothetical protein